MAGTISFFKKKNQFKEPYDILVDGPFISYMLSENKNRHHLSNLLVNSSVKLTATSCSTDDMRHDTVTKTLKDLGITLYTCGHKGRTVDAECILSPVQDGNKSGYFVATGDPDLVSRLEQVPWVPIITYHGREMVLKNPSDYQKDAFYNGS